MTTEVKIVSSVALATAVLIGSVLYFSTRNLPPAPSTAVATADPALADAGLLVREDSYSKGDADAEVTVVEFADFQCEACRASYPQVEGVLKDYEGRGVRFVLRNFPLPNHKNSQIAANAAEAAGEQGKYWEMYSKLFAGQDEWTSDPPRPKSAAQATAIIAGYARELGLDEQAFRAAVDGRKFNAKLSRDLADGEKLGINGTPTFFVNGVQAQEVGEIRTLIERELAK